MCIRDRPSENTYASWIVSLGSVALFRSDGPLGEEPWISDGTADGTQLLVDLYPGAVGSSPWLYGFANGVAYFNAVKPGTGRELFRSDGTVAGTGLVLDLNPGPDYSNAHVVGIVGNDVYFSGYSPTIGSELWVFDGTPGGAQLVLDIVPGIGGSSPSFGAGIGGVLYFAADDGATGYELWRSDGTAAGTFLLGDLNAGAPDSDPTWMEPLAGGLFFVADDGIIGEEPWFTDGTAGGTAPLVDAWPPALNQGSFPILMGAILDRLVFSASGPEGRELWVSDGTEAGTVVLADLEPGPAGSTPGDAIEYQGRILFRATTTQYGREWWITDGTAAGTQLLLDIVPGPGGWSSGPAVLFQDRVWFEADDGVHGRELWSTDGTPAGTQMLVDLAPGADGSWPAGLFPWQDRLYYSGYSAALGTELYSTDGTPGGTGLVKDIYPGPGDGLGFLQPEFGGLGNYVYFRGWDGIGAGHGAELWRSDGTEAGTTLVKDLLGGPTHSNPEGFANVGNRLVFRTDPPLSPPSQDLWRTNGTAAGTWPLMTFPGEKGVITDPVSIGDAAVFWVDDGSGKTSLWRANGSSSGTFQVDPDPAASSSGGFGAPGSGEVLVFPAVDPLLGLEPWRTDGTEAGTYLLADLLPGGASSKAGQTGGGFVRVGTRLFTAADDGIHGTELHAVDFGLAADYAAEPFGAGCAGTGGLVPSISTSGKPTPSSAFAVELADALPSTAALLLGSTAPAAIDLGGCTLQVQPPSFAFATATDAAGEASLPLAADAGTVGLLLAFQYVVVDPGGTYLGLLSATEGLEVVVGP